MTPPTIVFVPGFWEGSAPFEKISSILQGYGFPTEIAALISTGKISPGNPNMLDDIAAIRSAVRKLVESGQEVIMVMHSGGGFLGSNAIEGLGMMARGEAKGCVTKLIFVAAALYLEGFQHKPLPFFAINGGELNCQSPETLLFNDLDSASAENWMKKLQPQPSEGWDETITYCGWRDVPSVYLVCENDQVLPPQLQFQLAGLAGSKVEKCGAGHMPFLSMPEKVAEVVKNAIA